MVFSLVALLTAAVTSACPTTEFVPHDGALRVRSTDLSVGDVSLNRALTTSLPFKGQFGLGFAIEEELRVEQLPGGALRATVPGPCPACTAAIPEPSPDTLSAAVSLAAATLRASGVSTLVAEAEAYASALARDPAFRASEWQARREAWLGAARNERADGVERLPVAARYRVVPLPSGFLRFVDGSLVQELDASGRLLRAVTSGGLSKSVERDAGGRITRIVDRRGRFIALDLDASGRVVRALGDDGSSTTYGYDGGGRMIWSQSGDERTEYVWGSDDRLVQMSDPSRRVVAAYEPKERGGRVLSLEDSAGAEEAYEYVGEPGGLTRAVVVHPLERDGAATERGAARRELRRYSFVEPRTSDGRRWTWQETVEEDGVVRAKVYDDRTFQPLMVGSGDRVATFTHDDFGRLVRKESGAEVTDLTYEPGGRVASVSRRTLGDSAGAPREVRFRYGANGELAEADGMDRSARVDWDARHRLRELTVTANGKSTHLSLEYNDRDRPVRIEVEGIGSIGITYDEQGNIQRTESTEGSAAALRMSGAFLELQSLVGEANVPYEVE